MTKKVFFICILALLFSCTTEKNTWVTRTYHNTTSRYNILFNGRESFNATNEKIKSSYNEDFSQILPIFIFEEEEIKDLVIGDMERALTKGSKIITFHSITAKPERRRGFVSASDQAFYNQKEFNKWMDNNYLLIGKAHFYKGDYSLANETFRYIISQYPESNLKQETYIWLARTYNVEGDFREAEDVLTRLTNDFDMHKNIKSEFYATYADFYIKQENYSNAIPMLEKAVVLEKNKNKKIRYTYILAQLNLNEKNFDSASQLFEEVIKMNPPYEMTFNAQISLALAFQTGGESSEFIKEELESMLKDDKNIEYQDQIYYALANIYFKEGDVDKAIELYKLSASKSTNNVTQKAISHLAIADIYYDRKVYLEAQAYYDSAVVNINNDFKNYDVILAKSTSLGRLVENIRKIELQDSLQNLASLPEDQRLTKIDQIIEQLKEEERIAKEQEAEMKSNNTISQSQFSNSSSSSSAQGKWYFYNMTAKSVGQPEFKMKWGSRKLEDNWRRSNKKQVIEESIAENSPAEEGAEQQNKVTDNKTREYYLQDLPVTDSAIDISNNTIMEALFAVGLIYENELFDDVQAKKSYEELASRFPENEYAAMAYYAMYEMTGEQETATRNSYKTKILNNYPESIYARILQNPGYLKTLEEEETKVDRRYEQAYQLFKKEDYQSTLQICNNSLIEFKGENLEPNFAYLSAVSLGKLNNDSVLREQLVQFVKTYPKSAPVEYANTMLSFLDNKNPQLAEAKEEEIALELYSTTEDTIHFVGLIARTSKEMNQLVFNIINYNLDNYEKLNLVTNGEDLNANNKMITIQRFNNKKEAENYLNTILTSETVFKDIDKDKLMKFSISENNYEKLKTDKSVTRYLKFYSK